MNSSLLRARMTRAVSVCTVAVVALSVGSTAGCGIKLRQVPHGDVDTSTPPGLRSQQLIDMLNSNWPIGKQGVATLAAANKVDDYTEIMTKLWVDRPYKVSSVDLAANSSTVHLIAPYGANVDIGLRTNTKGDVDRLVPYQQPPTIADWSDVDTALSASGGRYSYRASKIVNGQCEQVAGTNTSVSMPLASVFKLYVLLATGTAINAGTLTWDDQLTVTDRGKALGSSMDKLPTGSTVSVRTAAQKMISVSDNMGTDMLINRVGRQAIEKALADGGHHDPASMTPFPTMHELFNIGWGVPDVRQQWKDATTPAQRGQMLAEADTHDYKLDPDRTTTPASKFGIEWYGSAEDICRVHAALQKVAVGPAAPIRSILSAEPGIDLHSENWRYIAAKGGNLPGDLTFSWYAEDRNRQPYVVSFQLNWDRAFGPGAAGWVIGLAKGVFKKLG